MLASFESVVLCAFLFGVAFGALLSVVIMKSLGNDPTTREKFAEQPLVKLRLPEEVFLSRTGRCYHLQPFCLKRETNVNSFRVCKHCLKSEVSSKCSNLFLSECDATK